MVVLLFLRHIAKLTGRESNPIQHLKYCLLPAEPITCSYSLLQLRDWLKYVTTLRVSDSNSSYFISVAAFTENINSACGGSRQFVPARLYCAAWHSIRTIETIKYFIIII